MNDKFAEYYCTPERIEDLSEYVHINMKIIATKMASELRRKLDIEPELSNKDGYVSLIVSLQGRIFNECVYSLAGICQSTRQKLSDIVPLETLRILLCLLQGENPLNGNLRNDVPNDKEKFQKEYNRCIDELRSVIEGLPK